MGRARNTKVSTDLLWLIDKVTLFTTNGLDEDTQNHSYNIASSS